MKTKILSVLMFFAVAFLSCKKDNDEGSDFLTSKTWKRALIDKNVSTNPVPSPFGLVSYYPVQDFEKDDTFKFGTDGKLTINRGTLKSTANQPQTEVQNFSFNNLTQQLTIGAEKFTLAEQSKNQLKYYSPLPESTGYKYMILIFE